mmetsp:Transcript_11418/g.14316  ORF Transcript_11418/g.14316 Transcript_11418/m.14316 type:complete len:128 (-) Transcript_11418:2622-3005(-)
MQQHALKHQTSGHLNLSKGIHDDIDDFRLLLQDVSTRPTRSAEVIPLVPPFVIGNHDASDLVGAGGIILPDGILHPQKYNLYQALEKDLATSPILATCGVSNSQTTSERDYLLLIRTTRLEISLQLI